MGALAAALHGGVEVRDGVEGSTVGKHDPGTLRGCRDLVGDALGNDPLGGGHGVVPHLRQPDPGSAFAESAGAGHGEAVAAQLHLDPLQQKSLAGGVRAEYADADEVGHHRVGSVSGSGAPGRLGGTAAVMSCSQLS